MQAHHLKRDISRMVYIMHGTPRPLECDSVRLGGLKLAVAVAVQQSARHKPGQAYH